MAPRCTVSAIVFSGRPDPVWTISEREREMVARFWARLAPTRTGPPAAPVLGYKGVSLACSSGERWFAYGGVCAHADAHGAEEFRADPDRAFERALVNTAPKGAVPVEF